VSVELSIMVVWVVFPIGLACIASGRIGRALAQLREGPDTPEGQALPSAGHNVVSSRVIVVSSPSASSVPAATRQAPEMRMTVAL
jgi:hypothetical protein